MSDVKVCRIGLLAMRCHCDVFGSIPDKGVLVGTTFMRNIFMVFTMNLDNVIAQKGNTIKLHKKPQ